MLSPPSAKHIPESIDWHDGMLLTAEHFRLMSARQERLQEFSLLLAHPFAWGVIRDIEFDQTGLTEGKLIVLHLEAIMPGGHLVTTGVHEQQPLVLDLAPYKERLTGRSSIVYLTLGEPGEPIGSQPPTPTSSVETFEPEAVPIPRTKDSLVLHIAESPAGRVRLPIARLRLENGSYVLSEYVPPSLRVAVQSTIGRLCAEISIRIREKAQFLSDRLTSPALASGSALELATQMQLQGLVSNLPVFETQLQSGVSHPYSLYLSLCALAGHIAGIGANPIPPTFQPYDHEDLLGCFQRLSVYITGTLEQGISEKWEVFPFEKTGNIFSLAPQESWQHWLTDQNADPNRVVLALGIRFSGDVPKEQGVRWGQNCVIGSRTNVPSLVSRRVLGLGRRFVNVLEDYYAPKDLLMLALTLDPDVAKPGDDLQVFDSRAGSPVPLQVLLYARKE